MKTLGTVVLSIIAVLASLVLVLSSFCAFHGDVMGSRRPSYLVCAILAFAVVVVTMWAIGRLNR